MKINWKVRLHNKVFVTSLASLLLVLANQTAAIFGYDITIYNEQITALAQTVLGILSVIGVFHDPTTTENGGLWDSDKAMTYGKKTEENFKKKGE